MIINAILAPSSPKWLAHFRRAG